MNKFKCPDKFIVTRKSDTTLEPEVNCNKPNDANLNRKVMA